MKRLIVLNVISLAIAAIIAGCSATGTPPPSPATGGQKPAAGPGKAEWEVKWEKILSTAKQEGEILVYFNGPTQAGVAIPRAFNEKFGIKMSLITGTSAQLTARINSEYRAGITQADILALGPSTIWASVDHAFLSPLESTMLLPEVRDAGKWRQGKMPFFDKDGKIVSYIFMVVPPVIYNSEMVKPSDITSYLDLLKPEWKGKIVMFDPGIAGSAQSGIAMLSRTWGVDKTREFLGSLVRQQEAVVTRDQRLPVEWVSRGKTPVALWPQTVAINEFLKVGAPIAAADLKETKHVSGTSGGVAMPVRPPHPNAAAVFINWFLSQEGQTLMVKTVGSPSTRVDVASEDIADMFIPKQGETYLESNEEASVIQTRLAEEWRKIIAAGGK